MEGWHPKHEGGKDACYAAEWGIIYALRRDGCIISSIRGNANVKVRHKEAHLRSGDLVEVTLDCDKRTLGWIRKRVDKEKGKKTKLEYTKVTIEMGETWHPYIYVETAVEGGADVKVTF